MEIIPLALPEVVRIRPKRFEDARGWFCETFSTLPLGAAGLPVGFVQDNLSFSRKAGTIRGLHFQTAPHVQDKLVRVVRGRILDVAIDIRAGSPTFGKHVSLELSGDQPDQLLIPAGFAHGFCTLTDDTEVAYKVTAHYAPAADGGIIWNDPDIAIAWPFADDAVILSDKDRKLPRLRDLPPLFSYDPAARKAVAS